MDKINGPEKGTSILFFISYCIPIFVIFDIPSILFFISIIYIQIIYVFGFFCIIYTYLKLAN
jgi:hypothetical protein